MICEDEVEAYDAGQTLFDVAFAVQADVGAAETAACAQANAQAKVETGSPDVRAVRVVGADDKTYLVAANFGTEAALLPMAGEILGGFTAADGKLNLPACACGVALLG